MSHHFRRLTAGVAFVMLAAGGALVAQQAQTPIPQQFNPQDVIPFDAAVRTAKLPNGLTYFIRHNEVPEKRVLLRLAVKAGSIDEADDQLGLAHFIEHMAFNGSTHFKPGELISTFEAIGARLGPHVNAYTSFDETVYMLELPTDKGDIVSKGLDAMADFAGGLTLDPAEIDKERGVVIEEWRGGLGAGSRIRDKQFPVLFFSSRYAERLPIGKPEILRTAPPARLRAFYDSWYRPENIAVVVVGDVDVAQIEQTIRGSFGPLAARAPVAPEPNRNVPLNHPLLVSVVTDPEVTRSSIQLLRKQPSQDGPRIADYRRGIVQRLIDYMIGQRLSELARRPDAPFLAAGAGATPLNRDIDAFVFNANVQDGKLEQGLAGIAIEARRMREFGFSAAELNRAKSWMTSFMEQIYNERDKTNSDSFAEEYIRHFLQNEPAPGIQYEYRLVQQLLPAVMPAEVSALARSVLTDDSRVLLAVSPQKPNLTAPSEAQLQAALTAAERTEVNAWNDAPPVRELLETRPPPSAMTARRELPALGMTVVTFANGVEAWLKPTDFKNDQVLFTLEAMGGTSLAAPADLPEADLADTLVGFSGVGGHKALDLQRILTGKVAAASPYFGLSTHGISGSAAPAQLETALQLLYLDATSPNDDAEGFALMKRQLAAALVNRGQSPQQVYGERLNCVNTSNHYTCTPLTLERAEALDRAKILSFYRERFANAADFTFFMVGAFKVDDMLPLLARYVGSLPSTGQRTSRWKDVQIQFPATNQRVQVDKGREPRTETVMSFFADPPPAPIEQEYVIAVTTVLDIALRDVLREQLGQTYTVGVGLSQPLPQRGVGHIQVQFGSSPENAAAMADRVLREIKRLQDEGPSLDMTNRAKETARRGYETALRDNNYWLRRLSTIRMIGGDPGDILTRNQRIDTITPQILLDAFKKDFPFDRYTVVTLVPEKQ